MKTYIVIAICAGTLATGAAGADRFAGYERVVEETRKASIEVREKVLRETVAEDDYWIKGNWGDTIWCLAALYLNEKTDVANKQLLDNANAFLDAINDLKENAFKPETSMNLPWPWAYFGLTDYLRILHLFHADSTHYPGRLRPETEAAMKEALWWLVKSKSKVAQASLDHILVHHGTENHDLTLRPNYYLAASLFKDDPAYKNRKYDDGHTAVEHYAAYNKYFREWPRQRAMIGLWFEMGSDTYQKYSWPALFNLHELSPDPLVRKRFGMLLDVAFIEEAQVSFRGRRGGGRSRAGYGKNNFESYKNLLYAPEGVGAGSSHSKVIETSAYQLPAAAILLRKMAFPAADPFLIINRVPGEMRADTRFTSLDATHNAYVSDSALLNYVYRTPHYLLGSTLQNPSLSMENNGKPVLKYSGISRQNRWSGMLFCDPAARFPVVGALEQRADNELCAVFPEIEQTRGGRPQHSFWSFQHENVLFLQRITPQRNDMGSYSTGTMSIRFHGKGLEKGEKDGWIFASNGKAFAAVKFLDGEFEWDAAKELASPVGDHASETERILVQAGAVLENGSFQTFQNGVLTNPLTVEKDTVTYRSGNGPELRCFRYDVAAHKTFKLPTIGGKSLDLRPDWTYRGPYLNGRFGDDKATVTVGPINRVYDFGEAH